VDQSFCCNCSLKFHKINKIKKEKCPLCYVITDQEIMFFIIMVFVINYGFFYIANNF